MSKRRAGAAAEPGDDEALRAARRRAAHLEAALEAAEQSAAAARAQLAALERERAATRRSEASRLATVGAFLAVGAAAVAASLRWSLELSSFAFGLGAVALALGGVLAMDIAGVKEFRTFEEIGRGNVAAAVYFLALCLLFGLGFLAGR